MIGVPEMTQSTPALPSAGRATPTPSPRAWEDVLAHIEADLVSGVLVPGDHLPSERTLAAGLGVGRSSVREALRVLEVLGLLRTQTGSGPESGAIIIARPSGGMSSLMRLQVAARGFRVDDVVSTRLILETAVAGQLAESTAAARRPSDATDAHTHAHAEATEAPGRLAAVGHPAHPLGVPDLTAAAEILDAMEATGEREPTAPEFLALDAQFHFSLAEAAGNDVIASMMTGLRNSIESYSMAGARNLASWAATATRLKREHRSIIRAIEAGDAHAARAAVNDHITGYYAEAGFGQAAPLPQVVPAQTAPEPRAAQPRRAAPLGPTLPATEPDAGVRHHAPLTPPTPGHAAPRKDPSHG
ncbi:hypothetical protein BH09ACT6_BH09ACT6_26120 [soil metagenome]